MFEISANPYPLDHTTWYTIHSYERDAGSNELVAANITITQSIDEIDTLRFDLYPQADAVEQIEWRVYKSLVFVTEYGTDTQEGDLGNIVFSGRIIGIAPQMDSDGRVFKRITCESIEAYLLDTCIDNTEYRVDNSTSETIYATGDSGDGIYVDAAAYLRWMLHEHMMQVYNSADTNIIILPGDITIQSDYQCPSYAGEVTRDAIKSLVKDVGGEIRFYEMPINDYLDTYGQPYEDLFTFDRDPEGDNVTVFVHVMDWKDPISTGTVGTIQLSENMISCLRETNYTDIVNYVEPYGSSYKRQTNLLDPDGKKIEVDTFVDAAEHYDVLTSADKDELEALGVTITKDSDNVVSVYDSASVAAYGKIARRLQISGYDTVEITDSSNSRSYNITVTEEEAYEFFRIATDYVLEHKDPTISIEVSAVDLGNLGMDIAAFNIYDNWRVVNSLIGVDDTLEIVSRTMYVNEPHRSTLELGKRKTKQNTEIAKYKNKTDKTASLANQLERTSLNNYTPATTSRLGGVIPDGSSITVDPNGVISASGIEKYHRGQWSNCCITPNGDFVMMEFPSNSHSQVFMRLPINNLKYMAQGAGYEPCTVRPNNPAMGIDRYHSVGVYLELATMYADFSETDGGLGNNAQHEGVASGDGDWWVDNEYPSSLRQYAPGLIIKDGHFKYNYTKYTTGQHNVTGYIPYWMITWDVWNITSQKIKIFPAFRFQFGYNEDELTPNNNYTLLYMPARSLWTVASSAESCHILVRGINANGERARWHAYYEYS